MSAASCWFGGDQICRLEWARGSLLPYSLIVFGVGKLPQAFGAIGKGIRAFKRAESGEDEDKAETPKAKKEVAKKTTKVKGKKTIAQDKPDSQ